MFDSKKSKSGYVKVKSKKYIKLKLFYNYLIFNYYLILINKFRFLFFNSVINKVKYSLAREKKTFFFLYKKYFC